MQLTKENTLKLYHYCTEIADALRPFLNTPNIYSQAEPEYWIPKLTEFKAIIDSVFDDPKIKIKDFQDTEADGFVFCGKCGKQK